MKSKKKKIKSDVYGAEAAKDKNFRFANRNKVKNYPPVPKTSGVNSIREE